MSKVSHPTFTRPISARDPDMGLCSEDQLLLHLAKPHINGLTQDDIVCLVKQGINWEVLFQKAHHHWIVLQIYAPLKQYCRSQIPSPLLSQLETYVLTHIARSIRLTEELLVVLRLLADHDIDAIPFKGPVLAVSAYGNLARRKFSDLDLLVSPQNFQRAIDLLIADANYQKQPTTFEVYDHEYPLIHPEKESAIDLHQKISGQDFYPFPMTLDALMSRLEQIPIMESTVRSFHPEDTVLMLCIHGSKHTWDQLGWICDFAAYIHSHPDIHWQQLFQNARVFGVSKMLALGLLMSYELLDCPIPTEIHPAILDNQSVRQLSQKIYQRLFHPTADMAKDFSLKRFFLHLQMMERSQDRGAYLHWNLRRLFTPTRNDTAQLKLPSALNFLYYGVRLFRLTRLFSQSLVSRAQ